MEVNTLNNETITLGKVCNESVKSFYGIFNDILSSDKTMDRNAIHGQISNIIKSMKRRMLGSETEKVKNDENWLKSQLDNEIKKMTDNNFKKYQGEQFTNAVTDEIVAVIKTMLNDVLISMKKFLIEMYTDKICSKIDFEIINQNEKLKEKILEMEKANNILKNEICFLELKIKTINTAMENVIQIKTEEEVVKRFSKNNDKISNMDKKIDLLTTKIDNITNNLKYQQ